MTVRTVCTCSQRAQICIMSSGGDEALHVMSWRFIGTLTVLVRIAIATRDAVANATKRNPAVLRRDRIKTSHAMLDKTAMPMSTGIILTKCMCWVC